MRIKISNIEWDVSDGYDGSDLPHYEEIDLTEEIGEMVDEILSDQYGYPIMSLEIEAMDDTGAL